MWKCHWTQSNPLCLSAPFIHTFLCFIFARLCFPGRVLTRTRGAAAHWWNTVRHPQDEKHQRGWASRCIICACVTTRDSCAMHQRARNPKFGNVLWTFCSAGSLTLIPGFDDPAPSLHRNMSMRVCVFPRAGTHVCLCVGGHPTLKVQLLLSPLSPNFFSLFPRHSWLQRPPLPDSLSS